MYQSFNGIPLPAGNILQYKADKMLFLKPLSETTVSAVASSASSIIRDPAI